MTRARLDFPCDACRNVLAGIDPQGRRLCHDCRAIGDKHCPALDARCPWPWDCGPCQMEET